MKLIIEFKETALGNVECVMNVPGGTASAKEIAYMDELIALLRIEAPKFGQARGAVAIVLDPKAKAANS